MKMVQIRNVPDEIHRTLKARAALLGMSLSDYLLAELRRSTERPTVEELRHRLEQREPVRLAEAPVLAVRATREGR
jgi:antitoxin FitA